MEIGASLDKAKSSYETSLNRLKTGKGNLISQAQKIKNLGVKSKKNLVNSLTEDSEDNTLLDFETDEEN
jgi:DNA recombination protein RmuC